jgi:hypothetical protein
MGNRVFNDINGLALITLNHQSKPGINPTSGMSCIAFIAPAQAQKTGVGAGGGGKSARSRLDAGVIPLSRSGSDFWRGLPCENLVGLNFRRFAAGALGWAVAGR